MSNSNIYRFLNVPLFRLAANKFHKGCNYPKAGHLFELVDFKLACSLVQGYVLSLFLSFFSTLRSLNITEVKAEGINV